MTGDNPAGDVASTPVPAASEGASDTTTTQSTTSQREAAIDHEAVSSHGHGREGFWALAVGSVGVVFGDIGTSPLYAMREALRHSDHGADAIRGVVSLIFWALIMIVTVKYVIFLMRADNKGEGGTLALMALTQKALGRYSPLIFVLGICGASLFYGDGIITPAVSVLGAIEGLRDAPGIGHEMSHFIVPISAVILMILFMVQSKGTAKVARFFGPITVVWFLVLGGLGLMHIFDDPRILYALMPQYGVKFLIESGLTGFVILGSVFLAVTGAEALYADMGHFGKRPIQFSWVFFVLPCLTLNYLGQGGLSLYNLAHHIRQAQDNPFWLMVPKIAYWPIMILATMAAVIASQAVITGAFSMTQQAVQLGLLPRIDIKRTSETQAGQIFVPQVNTMLLVGVLVLLFAFRSTERLTSMYGIAVTGAMMVDSLLGFVFLRNVWKWKTWQALCLMVPLGSLDLVFFSSNLLKIPEGAWLPLLLASLLILIMLTWAAGSRTLTDKSKRDSVQLTDLVDMLKKRPPHRVAGTAIFLTSDADAAPVALMHNLKHNKILHEKNIILTVRTTNSPRVREADRVTIEILNDDFKKITLAYGFMESPNLPRALGLCRKLGLKFDIMATSFFLGRRSVVPSANSGMPLWQDKLFIFLMKNSTNPTEFFHIPPGRVVELGTQVTV